MITEKKVSADGGVTEAYFDAKDKSNYETGIEKLYDLYSRCITLVGNYINS